MRQLFHELRSVLNSESTTCLPDGHKRFDAALPAVCSFAHIYTATVVIPHLCSFCDTHKCKFLNSLTYVLFRDIYRQYLPFKPKGFPLCFVAFWSSWRNCCLIFSFSRCAPFLASKQGGVPLLGVETGRCTPFWRSPKKNVVGKTATDTRILSRTNAAPRGALPYLYPFDKEDRRGETGQERRDRTGQFQ